MVFDYISKSTFLPGNNIDKFRELFELLKTATGRVEMEARFLLSEAIRSRVVHEKGGTYTWPSPEGALIIGEKYSEAIEFILNPKKQGLVEDLQNEIKAKNAI